MVFSFMVVANNEINATNNAGYGASLGGPLCDTSKMYVRRVRLMSHKSETAHKAKKT
jgi:hypothetical protein